MTKNCGRLRVLPWYIMITQLKFPRGKRDDRGWFRLAIEMNAAEKRAIRGQKGAENVLFWDNIAACDRCLLRECCSGRSAGADSGHGLYAPPKKIPNRSLIALIMTCMSHTSAIGRIFNAYIFRDYAHNRVHFDCRPEFTAIVSFATRIF